MLKYALAALVGFFLLITAAGSSHPQTAPVSDVQEVATSTSASAPSTTPTKTKLPTSGPSVSAPIKPTATTASPSPVQVATQTKTSDCVANQTLPDRTCSPGAVLTTDTSVICVSGYTKTVRDVPTSEKERVFAEYGIPWAEHSGYEVDHIISLELGGSNDISNLFPESYSIRYGARVKDTFENYLHKQVCGGNLSVAAAQQEISTDWLRYYLAWQGSAVVPITPPLAPASSTTVAAPTQADATVPAYYTSSYYSSRYYYPAACSAWKSLSSKYLTSFSSLQALLAKYHNKTLSPQCS